MPAALMDDYVSAFVARCNVKARPVVGVPGLHGAAASADHPLTRLLITDDAAYAEVAQLLPDVRAGVITVFASAPRCTRLVSALAGWAPSVAQAMVFRDLSRAPDLPLADGLTLHRVRRLPEDPPEGIALTDAVALTMLADPSMTGSPAVFADYLRSLAPSCHLFAAVDGAGVVRATSGCGVFGAWSVVIFVNTDPGWRRRGIGQAMTAVALREARDAGVAQAHLDASDAGQRMYRQMGFETVAPLVRFDPTS